jgi:hypothetical protein
MPKRGKTTVVMADIASILAELRKKEFPAIDWKPSEKLAIGIHEAMLSVQKPSVEQWDRVSKLLPELIALAEIQPNAYEGFCLAVQRRLRGMRPDEKYEAFKSSMRDFRLLEVVRRLRAAQDAIMALSDDQRLEIQMRLLVYIEPRDRSTIGSNWIPMDDHDRDPINNWVYWIPMMLQRIAEFTETAGESRPKRGAPKSRNNLLLHPLVQDLWIIALENGGKFTLFEDIKNARATGSIVEALHLLREVLPPGLDTTISLATLKRIKSTIDGIMNPST